MHKRVQGLVRTLTSTRDGPVGLYFLLSYRGESVPGAVDVRALEDAPFASPLVFTVSPSMDLGREQRSSDDRDPSPGSSIQVNVCINLHITFTTPIFGIRYPGPA